MDKMAKFLLAGNWKMNGGVAQKAQLAQIVEAEVPSDIALLLCPPFYLIEAFAQNARGALEIGAQDCHAEPSGAFTGDMSAEMAAELGARWVICGHSERRGAYGETNQLVRRKAEAAQRASLVPIICIGESPKAYEQGKTLEVLEKQLEESIPESGDFTIAYEPIWAIGTGKAASGEDIARAHAHIATFTRARILYGGSVNADNAAELSAIKGVGGFLIGSASLKAESFLSIMGQCKISS